MYYYGAIRLQELRKPLADISQNSCGCGQRLIRVERSGAQLGRFSICTNAVLLPLEEISKPKLWTVELILLVTDAVITAFSNFIGLLEYFVEFNFNGRLPRKYECISVLLFYDITECIKIGGVFSIIALVVSISEGD
jgi:hypothetical protein